MKTTGGVTELRIKSGENITIEEIVGKVVNIYRYDSGNFIMIVHNLQEDKVIGINVEGEKVEVDLDDIEFITYMEENEC